MLMPNYHQARAYACHRLQAELDQRLVYHSLMHTRDDVVPAIEFLIDLSPVAEADGILIRTAAWYHDIGFIVHRDDHEEAGCRIAIESLPRFGYAQLQIDRICGMIRATRLPQKPQNHLEALLADADLDSLGRSDFLATSLALRKELSSYGIEIAEREWYERQQQFLLSHTYFTEPAQILRNAQKQHNLELLQLLSGE